MVLVVSVIGWLLLPDDCNEAAIMDLHPVEVVGVDEELTPPVKFAGCDKEISFGLVGVQFLC